MLNARTSPLAPRAGNSPGLEPVITRSLYIAGGEETPRRALGILSLTTPIFKFTIPSLPKPGTSLPVLAFREMSHPSEVPARLQPACRIPTQAAVDRYFSC